MKIAHIDTGRDFRGGQDLLLSLAQGLRERKHRQLIVCPFDAPLAKRAAAQEFEVMTLGMASDLRRTLRQGRFDIIHAHDAKAQNISFRVSMALKTVRVASRLVAFAPRHKLIHGWKYSFTCHGVIALSQSVRRILLASGVPDSHIEVILPGIEIPRELPTSAQRLRARERYRFSANDFAIGHVAAFTREKGQDIALEAASLLAERLPQARMILVGGGRERLRLAENAPANARLPGFVDNVDEFYAALDLYIMPSRSEAWGLTVLEAMARGLPVVASDVGGLPEIVEHGNSGWLVPAESPQALADAIVDAASDPARLSLFAQNARTRAEQFSIERTVEQTEQYYLRLLANRRKETMEASARADA